MLIDTNLLRTRVQRSVSNQKRREDFILSAVAKDLIERLSLINDRQFTSILLQGEHVDVLARKMLEARQMKVLGENTKITLQSPIIAASLDRNISRVVCDNEFLCFNSSSFDVVISFLSLQHINDMKNYLESVKNILSQDGLFLACFVGGESLTTLRKSFMDTELSFYDKVSLRVLPFTDIRSIGDLLHRFGFKMIVTDTEKLVYNYSKFADITGDLRSLGWSNNIAERSRQVLGKYFLASLEANYRSYEASMDGNNFLVTYEILWLICWSKGKNQPKALKPGSANISLCDVLEKDNQ